MSDTKKPDKLKKYRIEEADVTEISLVPAGAVEDADYVVLHKEAPESEEDSPLEDDPAELLAKSVDAVVLGRESLTVEQAERLLEAAMSVEGLQKEDMPGGEMETEEEHTGKEDCMCKECKSKLKKSDSDRIAALEAGLQELLAKLSPDAPETPDETVETPAEELTKENDTEDEDPIARAARILEERTLAKAKSEADESQARLFAALERVSGRLESVANGVAETERQLARAKGQDA